MIKYRLKIFLSELVVDKSRILPAYFFTIDFSKKKKKTSIISFSFIRKFIREQFN